MACGALWLLQLDLSVVLPTCYKADLWGLLQLELPCKYECTVRFLQAAAAAHLRGPCETTTWCESRCNTLVILKLIVGGIGMVAMVGWSSNLQQRSKKWNLHESSTMTQSQLVMCFDLLRWKLGVTMSIHMFLTPRCPPQDMIHRGELWRDVAYCQPKWQSSRDAHSKLP